MCVLGATEFAAPSQELKVLVFQGGEGVLVGPCAFTMMAVPLPYVSTIEGSILCFTSLLPVFFTSSQWINRKKDVQVGVKSSF